MTIYADLFSNLWILIVLIYVIATIIGGIRRSIKNAGTGQPRLSPAQRYAEAAEEVAAAKRAGAQRRTTAASIAPRTVTTPEWSASLPDQTPGGTSATQAQPVREALVETLTQMLRAQGAKQGEPPAAVSMPSATDVPKTLTPPQPLYRSAAPAQPTDEPILAAPPAAGVAPDLAALIARLSTPSGLAFAIVAATIVGPPPALRTQPQEPGGW